MPTPQKRYMIMRGRTLEMPDDYTQYNESFGNIKPEDLGLESAPSVTKKQPKTKKRTTNHTV